MEGPPLAKRQIRNRGALTIELSLVELRFPSYRGGGGSGRDSGALVSIQLTQKSVWYRLALSWHTYLDMKSIRPIFLSL